MALGRNPKTSAKGNAADTGTPMSVAPVTRYDPRVKDHTWGRGSYGANGWSGASSIEPGAATARPTIAQNADSVLDQIVATNRRPTNSPDAAVTNLDRKISDASYPAAHGMHPANVRTCSVERRRARLRAMVSGLCRPQGQQLTFNRLSISMEKRPWTEQNVSILNY